MTEIYLHIVARMADYIATHPYATGTCYESQLAISTDPTDPSAWRMLFPPRNDSVGFIPLGKPGSFDSNYIGASMYPFMHPNRSRGIQLYYLANTMGDVLPDADDYDSIALAGKLSMIL